MTVNPDDTVFVKITNAQIYAELQELKLDVMKLNIKVYGVLGGMLAAIGLLLHQNGVF